MEGRLNVFAETVKFFEPGLGYDQSRVPKPSIEATAIFS